MMEPNLSNDRIQQALQRWRSVDAIGLGQFSPMSGSPSDLKFIMDDTLLTELMDLDPLVAQSPESWLNVSSPGSDSFFPFTSSPPSLPVSSSPLFYAVNSVTNPPCSLPIHSSGLPRASESEHDGAQRTKARVPGGVSLALAKVRSGANDLSPSPYSEDLADVTSLSGLLDYSEQQRDAASSSRAPTSDFKRSAGASSPGQLGGGPRPPLDNPVYERESSADGKAAERQEDFLDMLGSDTDLIFTGGNQDRGGRHDLRIGSKRKESFQRRMKLALDAINCSTGGGTLTQIWMPTSHGDRLILSTRDQPYALDDNDDRLDLYRSVSANFVFPTENGTSEYPGLPGRVFLTRAPEWTPNVMYYTSQEFLRVTYAAQCHVKGTIAVPVFEESSKAKNCLAVIELISKSEKVQYTNEIEIICKALKDVNLSTTAPQSPPAESDLFTFDQIRSEGRQTALAEILEVQTAVCETHKLPLAQTWIPCWTEGTGGTSETGDSGPSMHVSPNLAAAFSGDPRVILRTPNGAAPCYVADHSVWGFRHACAEHHLEKNQGVPGRAFSSNQPVFESDVRNYSKLQYPLGHYAKMFSLSAAVAIRLRSIYSGKDDYVLEFFLPHSCVDGNEQQQLLNALSITMQRVCRSLRTVTTKEITEENDNLHIANEPVETREELASRASSKLTDVQPTLVSRESQPQLEESRQQQSLSPHRSPDITHGEPGVHDPWRSHPYQPQDSAAGSGHEASSMKRRLDRRRGTNEKTIGLNVLQKYFAGSLKDAAKSIGVCPTTLKRICRQHGISRWPSRKINKVSRSLKKLQGVIDSVQGADGALRINADLASAAAAAAAAVSGVQLGGQDTGCGARNKWTVSWATPGATEHGEGQNGSDEEGKVLPSWQGRVATIGAASAGGRVSTDTSSHTVDVDMVGKVDTSERPATARDEGYNRGKVKSRTGENRVHGGAAALAALRGVSGEEKVLGCSRLGFAGLASDYRALHLSAAEENHSSSGADGSSHDINSSPSGTRGSDCGSPSSGVGSHQRMSSPTAHEESSSATVKATYGQDTIRFKLPPNAGYKDVLGEVANRLKLNAPTMSLKYLDDDAEWVLLACDADLDECLEVMRSTRSHAIKLMVRSEVTGGSSSGSTGEQ